MDCTQTQIHFRLIFGWFCGGNTNNQNNRKNNNNNNDHSDLCVEISIISEMRISYALTSIMHCVKKRRRKVTVHTHKHRQSFGRVFNSKTYTFDCCVLFKIWPNSGKHPNDCGCTRCETDHRATIKT